MFFRGNKKHPWLFSADHPTISNINFTIGQYLQCILDPRISWFSHLDPSNTAYSPLDPIKIEVPFPSNGPILHVNPELMKSQSIKKRTSKFPADPERITKSGKRLQFANWKDPPSLRTVNQRFLWAMFNSYVSSTWEYIHVYKCIYHVWG